VSQEQKTFFAAWQAEIASGKTLLGFEDWKKSGKWLEGKTADGGPLFRLDISHLGTVCLERNLGEEHFELLFFPHTFFNLGWIGRAMQSGALDELEAHLLHQAKRVAQLREKLHGKKK
jgi:hypothetical protein